MKLMLGIILWVVAGSLRAVLIVLGWLFVPISLLGGGERQTPKMWRMWADAESTPAAYATSRWLKYVWWAWRNPTPGLIERWQQPIPEVKPNPDNNVRDIGWFGGADTRWMQHGIYWEYWYLRPIRVGKYLFFEFRVGWKFVDGNNEFFPTFQLGPRSS